MAMDSVKNWLFVIMIFCALPLCSPICVFLLTAVLISLVFIFLGFSAMTLLVAILIIAFMYWAFFLPALRFKYNHGL